MFDPTKPVRTRCGWRAEILCTDIYGNFPIFAAYWDESGKKLVSAHTSHGYYYGEAIPNRLDLFNIPEKRTLDIHVNYYASGVAAAHPSRKEADQCATPDRIACLHIVREFEEGEGL